MVALGSQLRSFRGSEEGSVNSPLVADQIWIAVALGSQLRLFRKFRRGAYEQATHDLEVRIVVYKN